MFTLAMLLPLPGPACLLPPFVLLRYFRGCSSDFVNVAVYTPGNSPSSLLIGQCVRQHCRYPTLAHVVIIHVKWTLIVLETSPKSKLCKLFTSKPSDSFEQLRLGIDS